MQIILKNKELSSAINFLQSISLKAADSRHRSKLVSLLVKAYEEFSHYEKKLMDEFELLDENGKLIDESKRVAEKVVAFNKEQFALSEEEIFIEDGMFIKNLAEIPRILSEYDGELSGQDAEIYDRLLDEFEKNDTEKVAE
ncbi:DUF1617 family protein [Enterococcus hulanensis]|uniref:DUF1617 family protein n=1 Tax=Enterococcus TaxID=1350 RepID=UPI000B5A60B5|nr:MULTISPECIES: DUF1617 family protein [Enterococcus]MBO0413234.1 DUF1617 family protein [Enterococcus hulanensis]OTO15099.1 hypothetical protein A5875_004256 [Enterococcus sp. 3H8_DIV0648]